MSNQNINIILDQQNSQELMDYLSTKDYYLKAVVESINTNFDRKVTIRYSNDQQLERKLTVPLALFLNMDQYSWLLLLRYTIRMNNDICYQDFWSIVNENQGSLSEIKKSLVTKFMKLHFNNLNIDFDSFLALVYWICNWNIDMQTLLNSIHTDFFKYVQNMVKMFYRNDQLWDTANEIGTATDMEHIKIFTSRAMSVCCSNYPILMAENQGLDVAFNLKKIFAYVDTNLISDIYVLEQEEPLKTIGEYVQLYLKLTDSALYHALFKTNFKKTASEIVVWDFEDFLYISSQTDFLGKFLQNLVAQYKSFIDLKILNKNERKIYLRFIEGDKVLILLQSNQKASTQIARAMINFLEWMLGEYPLCVSDIKFNMTTFSSGLNLNSKNDANVPFEYEIQRLMEQMIIDLKPYDLLSQMKDANNNNIRQQVFELSQIRPPPYQKQPQQIQQCSYVYYTSNQQKAHLFSYYTITLEKCKEITVDLTTSDKHYNFLREVFEKYLGAELLINSTKHGQIQTKILSKETQELIQSQIMQQIKQIDRQGDQESNHFQQILQDQHLQQQTNSISEQRMISQQKSDKLELNVQFQKQDQIPKEEVKTSKLPE